jgi:8-oxo-dGTP pyrophosphatase MutT (NUDIX family)
VATRAVAPRPAASVVVLRQANPFEVLVVKRRGGGTFGDLVVFPGGTVDESDRTYRGSNDRPDSSQRAAVLRELAEETGILVLEDGAIPVGGRRGDDIYRWLDSSGNRLAVDSLTMVSRWVTPEVMPYRFDTWFYLLVVSDPPAVVVDESELTGHQWVAPSEALARGEEGAWQMILPTVAHLRWLARRESIEDALASASGADGRTLIIPEVMGDGSMVPVHMPSEPS